MNNNVCDQRKPDKESNPAETGRPPKRLLRKKERMVFRIHDFARCTAKRGEYRITPILKAHGHDWKLQVFPRGDNRSSERTEYVSCFLHCFRSKSDQNQAPFAKVEYRCGAFTTESQICSFAIEKGKCSTSWGLENFIRRDRILQNFLDSDGALVIDISIQIAVDAKAVWYPTAMKRESAFLRLYERVKETGDVTFRLTASATHKQNRSPSKSQFTSNTPSFCECKAHKSILVVRAKLLCELVREEMKPFEDEPDCSSDNDAVDLPGIDRETFEAVLEHIYTVRQPSIRNGEEAKKILVAADRFCLTDLKLYVESVLVDRFVTIDNAASLLLFADSYSCALLKEAAMNLCVDDPDYIVRDQCWSLVEQSETLLSELSKHVHTGCRESFHTDTINRNKNHKSVCNGEEVPDDSGRDLHTKHDCLDQLDVFSIREQLGEHGLDVDGSRKMLLRRLRNL